MKRIGFIGSATFLILQGIGEYDDVPLIAGAKAEA
jgi:hypothetical protein